MKEVTEVLGSTKNACRSLSSNVREWATILFIDDNATKNNGDFIGEFVQYAFNINSGFGVTVFEKKIKNSKTSIIVVSYRGSDELWSD